MPKYNYVYILLIISLLLCNIILVIRNNKAKYQTDLLFDKINRFAKYYELMEWREKETVLNSGLQLSDSLIIMDENKNCIALSSILEVKRNSPVLFIRYSALACDICLEEELKLLEDYISRIGLDNIIILASGYNIRGLKVLAKSIPFDLQIYQIEETGIPFENKNHNLFTFIMNRDLIVKDFFISEKTLPELSKNYYKILCEKYW
jgi:hypothetical protein